MAVIDADRPVDGRPDPGPPIGHRNVLLPCLVAPPAGLLLLALAQGTNTFLVAAIVFGAGFGLMYPAYTAYVMAHVPTSRRGAAFGAMLAAFDTGIGTGSYVDGLVDSPLRISDRVRHRGRGGGALVAAVSVRRDVTSSGYTVIWRRRTVTSFRQSFFRTLGRDVPDAAGDDAAAALPASSAGNRPAATRPSRIAGSRRSIAISVDRAMLIASVPGDEASVAAAVRASSRRASSARSC